MRICIFVRDGKVLSAETVVGANRAKLVTAVRARARALATSDTLFHDPLFLFFLPASSIECRPDLSWVKRYVFANNVV